MTKAFSSSLSVPGLLTIEQVGLCPLGQVQGSSIYRAGWQRMPRMKLRWRAGPRVLETGYVGSGYVGTNVYMPPGAETALQFINEGTWIELEKQTEAYNNTRGLALDRLREAAQRAGANGVVDVRIRRGPFRPLRRGVEFTAIGTAVAGDPAQGVFLTNLSGEELRKLVAAGYRPVDIVGGVSVVYVIAGMRTKRTRFRLSSGSRRNQEYGDYTDALRSARSHAIGRLRTEALHAGATGVLGIELTHRRQEPGRFAGDREHDLTIHVEALGTAVALTDAAALDPPGYALDLEKR